MKLTNEKINYLLDAMGLDDPMEPSYIIGDIEHGIVQILHAGTAEDCLQYIAAKEFPDDMSFVTMENFESFDPQLVRPN